MNQITTKIAIESARGTTSLTMHCGAYVLSQADDPAPAVTVVCAAIEDRWPGAATVSRA